MLSRPLYFWLLICLLLTQSAAAIEEPILVKPAAGAVNGRFIEVDFTLPEAAAPGSVVLTFTGPHIYLSPEIVLSGLRETAGRHTFTFSAVKPTGGSISSGSPIYTAKYSVSLRYRNLAGESAASDSQVGFMVDRDPPQAPTGDRTVAPNAEGFYLLPDLQSEVVEENGLASFMQLPAAGTPLPVGTTAVQMEAKDDLGNRSLSELRITVAFPRAKVLRRTLAAVTGERLPAEGGFATPVPAGAKLVRLATPALNGSRTVAVRVGVGVGRKELSGIITKSATGAVKLVALEGGDTGVNGAAFKSLGDPEITAEGRIYFAAKMQGAEIAARNDDGLWRADPELGTCTRLFGEGEPVPDSYGYVYPKTVLGLAPMGEGLLVLLRLERYSDAATKPASTRLVLQHFGQDGTATRLLAEADSILVAESEWRTVKNIALMQPPAGSPGHGHSTGLTYCVLRLTFVDGSSALVYYDMEIPSYLRPYKVMARSGAGTGASDGSRWKSFGQPSADAFHRGIFPVRARVTSRAAGEFSVLAEAWMDGTALPFIAREGGRAPGTTQAFDTFLDPLSNNRVAFFATLRGPGINGGNSIGLWYGQPGALKLIARQGSAMVPGQTGALVPRRSWFGFESMVLPDETGPAFIAYVRDASAAAPVRALYAHDSRDVLLEVLRTGETVGGRKVAQFGLFRAPRGTFGAGRNYERSGSLAAMLTFADGGQGLLRIDVP